MSDRPWHTPFEAAVELKLSMRTIRALIADGRLPTRKLGRMDIVLDADLESYRHHDQEGEVVVDGGQSN